MNLIPCPSTNFDERANKQPPSMIILHYTGTRTAEEARVRFMDAAPTDQYGRLSPHYMIGQYAEVFQFVDEDKRAWHAGRASWGDITDINSASIGIEIWNTGHEFDFEPFMQMQIDALIELINAIRSRWNIPDKNILGHSDIAPGRKLDPGEKFPWKQLAEAGIGVMPSVDAMQSSSLSDDDFFKMLKEYGYTYTNDRTILLAEFRRHFMPHLLGHIDITNQDKNALVSLIK